MKTLTHEEIDQAVTTAEPIHGAWADSLFTVNPGVRVVDALEDAWALLSTAHGAFRGLMDELGGSDVTTSCRAFAALNTLSLAMALVAAANSSLNAYGRKK